MGASYDSMPQENYRLIDFDLDESLENLRKSSLVLGGTGDEDISYTKGVICTYIKVKDEKVSFNLSQYGKIQISHGNNEVLRRAKSHLKKLIVCKRWSPTDEAIREEKLESISQDLKYKKKIEEADPEEVKSLLDALERENDPRVLEFDLKNLKDIANQKRIAHLPNVLPFLENALKDPKFQDAKLLKELIQLTDFMLGFERRITSPRQNLIDRIQNDMLLSILQSSERVTDQEVLRTIIYCLGKTDREESVDAVSNIVERVDDDLYHNLKSAVTHVLFNVISPLQNSQKTHIDETVRKLIKHQTPTICGRGIELSNHPR